MQSVFQYVDTFFSPKFYDPRVWVREGEKTLSVRVKEACKDLGNVDRL